MIDVTVSIHAPAWGATLSWLVDAMYAFQSTRPRGARLDVGSVDVVTRRFNPRARVGRDALLRSVGHGRGVSIHAPAWGATDQWRSHRRRRTRVSIHAPAWGATADVSASCGRALGFNPRARVGRDTSQVRCADAAMQAFQSTRPRGARRTAGGDLRRRVSIHAPAWARRTVRDAHRTAFQSTRPRGARRTTIAAVEQMHRFQSTRPRGARRRRLSNTRCTADVSIHAPAWGATILRAHRSRVLTRFNPRARVGRDPMQRLQTS